MICNIKPANNNIMKNSVEFENVLAISAKPANIQDKNKKCTPVMIVLYLPVFTSASRPKKGKKKYIRQDPISKTKAYLN